MVALPTKMLALLAVLLATTDAASYRRNPWTPLGRHAKLTHKHPAFGGFPAPDMVKPVVRTDDGQIVALNQSRRLETSASDDIATLESYFGSLVKNLDALTTSYKAYSMSPSPWPGSYWPTYKDSINAKWVKFSNGSYDISPAEKYARATGIGVTSFMDKISAESGIDSCSWCSSCTSSSQCGGDYCAIRAGKTTGKCMASWWGICHAWSPAAILESEGKCSVPYNGQTFRVGDLKALMSAIYDEVGLGVIFTGARYDGSTNYVDSYGRYTDAAERDLGPGFFHIAVTNIMGKNKRSFVVDVTASAQVWNQPVRGYSVDVVTKMTPSAAASQYFGISSYIFNTAAKQIAYVKMSFSYILEGYDDISYVSTGQVDAYTKTIPYEYLLELDSAGNIIGGEWVGGSRTVHPDFLWFVTDKPAANTVATTGLDYSVVSMLLAHSKACTNPTPTTTTTPTPTTTATPTTTPTGTAPSYGACGTDATGAIPCPAGQYCQPWNPTQYLCRTIAAKCGTQETGYSYSSTTLKTLQVLLPDTCCDECFNTAGCIGYTFINYNPDGKAYCYLKSSVGTRVKTTGAVSATVVPSATTTATPTTTPTPTTTATSTCPQKEYDLCGNPTTGAKCCPAADYCQPWDVNYFQCIPRPAKCSKQYPQVDLYGNDIKTVYGVSPSGCCDACAATAGCKAYTYVNDNPGAQACYLKKAVGAQSYLKTGVSGVLN